MKKEKVRNRKLRMERDIKRSSRDVKEEVRPALIEELHRLSGHQILGRLLEMESPREWIQALPAEDFFWLIKKIGDADALTLLEMATEEQWEYILDLELWRKDRMEPASASAWIRQLQQADCKRLARWFFSEQGQNLAYAYFHRNILVITPDNDEAYDLPESFLTVDGIHYFRILDPEQRDTLEGILRAMAAEAPIRYQAFLSSLPRVLPAELEEEMCRTRSVRLAEHGFLPYEEAVSVYSPLNPETLNMEENEAFEHLAHEEEIRSLAPTSPLYHADIDNTLTQCLARSADPLFLDRMRLEFAGLCNQILSAEGFPVTELETLKRVCRKAGRFINLALDRVSAGNSALAEQALQKHSLLTFFRVGFGLALKLKWEAERWLKTRWFGRQGLGPEFWGEHWGGLLSGLLFERPRYYVGSSGTEEYKDFEWLSEIGECMRTIRRLMVLDSLLERLTQDYPLNENIRRHPELTFHPFLFNLWARLLLSLEPSFSAISGDQMKRFFHLLREGNQGPPYSMSRFRETFIDDFMAYAVSPDSEARSSLEEALTLVWQQFSGEYEWIPLDELDGRYSSMVVVS
jgi:hypothetical protein